MAKRLSENLEREWDRERSALELWDAVHELDKDRASGVSTLERLAEEGSPLAMVYLGNAFWPEDGETTKDLAEHWLRRAAEAGSLEGRYQLAKLFEWLGDGPRAVAEHRQSAQEGYGPSMYLLGRIFYAGRLVAQDIPQAVSYLERAKRVGHLPTLGLLAYIYRKEAFGLQRFVTAQCDCIAKFPIVIWYAFRHPSSDRMRGFSLPSKASQARG
jgi:TPR repeat protein